VVYSDGLITHRSCFLRAVAGAAEGDPPGMTKRQPADAIIRRMLGTSSETRPKKGDLEQNSSNEKSFVWNGRAR
jgi:hypothetical protein